jgi:hypothetical protein
LIGRRSPGSASTTGIDLVSRRDSRPSARNSEERHDAAAYCAGFIEFDPISRVSFVTQLICRLYPLGVRV